MKYDVDYFLNKFAAIDEEYWCTGAMEKTINGVIRHCAMGHCGAKDRGPNSSGELNALRGLLPGTITDINDGHVPSRYPQNNPRERIINALCDVRERKYGRYRG